MDEVVNAMQVLRFSYDGLRVAMDVTGASLKSIKNIVVFIYGLLHNEKVQGKTGLKKMLKKNGNLQVLKISEKDVKAFKKLAKKYGILYSKMPDINMGDGMKEFIFPVEATARINALIEKLGRGKIEDITEYVQNGDESFKKTMKYLKDNNHLPTITEIEPKRAKELRNIADQIKISENFNDLTKVDVTISKHLVKEKKEDSIVTRVPGTFGKNARYIEIKNAEMMSANGGKTIYAFLTKDKEYELLDRDGKVVKKIKGEDLRNEHYDVVSDNVRNRMQRERDRREKDRRETNQKKSQKQKNLKQKEFKQSQKHKESKSHGRAM